MDYIVSTVKKYQERLDPQSERRKIFRALQKLKEVDMTVEILQVTGVGKSVNNLKKIEGIGDFAKEIVLKWKKLLRVPRHENDDSALQYNNNIKKGDNDEYDPTKNWVIGQLQVKKEDVDTEEYDPTQNWMMPKQDIPQNERSVPKTAKKRKIRVSEKNENQSAKRKFKPFVTEPCMTKHTTVQKVDKDDFSPSPVEYDETDELESANLNSDDPVSDDPVPPFDDEYTPSVKTTTLSSTQYHESYPYPTSVKLHDRHKEAKKIKFLKTDRLEAKQKQNVAKSLKKAKHDSRDTSPKRQSKDVKNGQIKTKKTTSSLPSDSKALKHYTSKGKGTSSEPVAATKKKTIKTETKKSSSSGDKKASKGSKDTTFEQFMMMDTSKTKKKKKIKKDLGSASVSKVKPEERFPAKPKVELHLPQIKTTYRPLPQTSLQHAAGSTSNKAGALTDAMAAELHSKRSSSRMQVYSGQKANYLPKMLSLYDQCMNVLLNNIDKLDVIGGVPYDIIKPVLERCTVEQLYRLEDANVYLLEDTDELWEKHAKQDFRSHEPEEMESWREMYLRYHDAREAKFARLTQSIQTKVNQSKPLEKRTKLAYVGIGQAKPPRNVLRAQLKYGTAGKKPIPYQDRPTKSSSRDKSTSSEKIKQQVTEIRMSVPVGTITASTVDEPSWRQSRNEDVNNRKQVPRVAPLMAKTLKSINKFRYKR